MAEEERKKISLETWLKVGFMVSLLVSVVLISLVSLDKETVFSPYEQDRRILQHSTYRNAGKSW